ncbi:4-hydroxyphenylpyruvate dioxygenase [bacterium K02(2017)]|nr:4-hydroxyphenylpyruvate dioxygenase [bacterium K02(2017)]
MTNSLDIKKYDYIEFYVGSAKTTAYWFAKSLGFNIEAYMGPETGVRDRSSYYLTQNNIKMVITSSMHPASHDIISFLAQHGEGVKRWSLEVGNVRKAFEYAHEKGAIPIKFPEVYKDENGTVEEAAIRVYDDTEIMFINRDNYKGLFKPGYQKPPHKRDLTLRETPNLEFIDHIVGNVRENEMDRWASYLNNILDTETFIDFKPGDIATKYSALLSKVVRTKDNILKNPINEPYGGQKKSQIEEFIESYHGTGVQHIAIATKDIISTISALRKNGVEFLETPKAYYDNLRKRNDDREDKLKISENIDDLEKLNILCDLEGEGYLLQLFTKPISDRPTFFFEIVQRRMGAQGFGKGNFQALFDSIEQDQEKRGNLTATKR